jgi:hypothetical protein
MVDTISVKYSLLGDSMSFCRITISGPKAESYIFKIPKIMKDLSDKLIKAVPGWEEGILTDSLPASDKRALNTSLFSAFDNELSRGSSSQHVKLESVETVYFGVIFKTER